VEKEHITEKGILENLKCDAIWTQSMSEKADVMRRDHPIFPRLVTQVVKWWG